MTAAEISQRIARLSPEQRALLERRLLERGATGKSGTGTAGAAIPRRQPGSPAPLSFTEQRLWFLDQLDPDSTAYTIARTVRLGGTLDVPALEAALTELVTRQEVLRTTYPAAAGAPQRAVAAPAPFDLPLVDLSALPVPERDAAADRLIEEASRRRFRLDQGPLLRARLLRLGQTEHLLVLTIHHIVSDGWSMGILFRELAELYCAHSEGRPAALPELPVQYADFAAWQGRHFQGPALEGPLAYWRERLAGAPTVLDLPADRARPAVASFRGARLVQVLPPSLTEGLTALGRSAGATLFMTLLAGFQTLLHRYTGQDDFLVGAPFAGRSHSALEGLIGFFANTVVLRANLAGDPTFRTLLQRVRETCLGAYAHQDLPFEQLVEALQPERDASRNPLVQVLLALQPQPTGVIELPHLTLESLASDTGGAKLDLVLSAAEAAGGLQLTFEYSTDLFEAGTIERLAGHFRVLLQGAVAAPDAPLSELPLLTAPERHQLLLEWNRTTVPYPADVCLHQLVEAQAGRTPHAVAVVYGEERLTYGELDRRANQLAHYLQGLGVGPEVPVGLCLDRSPDLVVGVLAILKAGGAYVPLDPRYPAARLAFMLEDTRVPVLVAHAHLASRLPAHGARVVLLDTDLATIDAAPVVAPTAETTPDSLAYVLYTSGSTGRPKGIAVEHRSPVALVDWAHRVFSIEDLAGVLGSTSVSFDLSVFELFVPLSCGGSVVLVESVLDLPTAPAAGCVTLVNSVPSAVAELLRAGPLPAAVRTVNLAGEALPGALVQQLYEQDTVHQVFNLYGPSEDTTYSTFALIPRDAEGAPTIGRPIANTRLYVLDAHRRPVPVGVPGELYLGGAGLARGYLGRPELTAERFVPDPFSRVPGARLYRTGDRARFRPDGDVEFLGRLDQQVKLRGFRIELGEIEAALAAHPAVSEAAVLAREDRPGDRQLVAYLVLRPGQDLNAGALQDSLRQSLRRFLPEYMVPAAFVPLAALPLTPNGKLDRNALPAPEADRSTSAAAYASPTTPTEAALAAIWRDVLRLDRVGIHDSFFEIGGHSLLAMQIITRLRDAFPVELPLRALFEAPTIAALAERIERASGHGQPTTPGGVIIPLPRTTGPDGATGPTSAIDGLALSFAQQRLWFLDQLEPGAPTYNIPLALRLSGRLDVSALEHSLGEIVRRHEALRTTFPAPAGDPVQVIGAGDVPLRRHSLLDVSPSEREHTARRLAVEEARRPFDLALGPVVRALLLQLAPDDSLLVLTIHHIAADGWSMDVLLQELGALYGAFASGRPSPLAPLPIQYADFAAWQRQALQGPALETQLAYWRRQLAGAPPVLELPADRPRPAVPSYQGARVSVALPTALTEQLGALGRREEVTLFMTLLAAFQALLHRYTDQVDVVVGSPIAGRPRRETEPLIGFFVNTVVLRADLAGDPTFRTLLQRVRETCLGAYAHQDLPFEQLVEALQPERDASRNPFVQILIQLQQAPAAAPDFGGLAVAPENLGLGTAKFDLTLTLSKTAAGLGAVFTYSTDLFEAGTIERLAGHYRALLEGAVAAPETRLSQLPLLTVPERHQVVVAWNATAAPYPAARCVHTLVAEQAARTPDAVAVSLAAADGGAPLGDHPAPDGDASLTYGELDRRANRLAHHLRALGVAPGDCVGVCLERSPDLIVALLAVLKAGGAYVPLDPSQPPERLRGMLADAGARVLLTVASGPTGLLDAPAGRTVCLDRDRAAIARAPEHTSSVGEDGEDDAGEEDGRGADRPAYVMYTSGSTGAPKGVIVPHRAITRLVLNTDYVSLHAADVVGQASNPAFDAATFEVWGALLHGARLVILPKETLLAPRALGATIRREGITTLFLTTALFNEIARQAPAIFGALHNLLVGGEAAEPQAMRAVLRHGPPGRLLNVYGPTETTTFATWHLVTEVGAGATTVPIGRPIANTTAFVLDQHQEPVPVGVPGELYLGGPGVARGYLGRPELTAQKFVPDPFADPGAGAHAAGAEPRLYKTGDRVRRGPDGVIEFLGRLDQQVKLRGFRIELGEIEAALAAHPAVQEALVLVREDRPGVRQLVAYLVPRPGPTPTGAVLRDALRTALRQRLPEYMIPVAFMILESFPLTPNGKVDRPALPIPEDLGVSDEAAHAYEAPRDDIERELTRLWEDVLGRQPVGLRDDFFELGGHSLLAVRLVARIEATFGKRLPLASFFRAATVEDLAHLIRDEATPATWRSLVPIRPRGGRRPLFLVHGAFGDVLCFGELAHALTSDQPVYGLQARGLGGTQAPHTSVEEMASAYLEEVRTVQPTGPYAFGGYSSGGSIAFEMARQLTAAGEVVALLAIFDHPPAGGHRERPVQWTPAYAWKFGANIWNNVPYWLQRVAQIERRAAPAFLRSGGKIVRSALVGFARGGRGAPQGAARLMADMEGTLGLEYTAAWPTYRREVVQAQYAAIQRYRPRPYSGRMHLFRARRQSLFSAHHRDLGWGKLATEVVVLDVPGNHRAVLQRPHVGELAARLEVALAVRRPEPTSTPWDRETPGTR